MDAYIDHKKEEYTQGEQWEEKIITIRELLLDRDKSWKNALAENRDWILGGKGSDWKYYFNINKDLVICRRKQ